LSAQTDEFLGVIFPLSHSHIEQFLANGKNVFVKYCGKSTIPRHIDNGSKLYFYESKSAKHIVGEAKIIKITQCTIDEVIEKFSDRLFLTRDELNAYANGRRTKMMLVLTLEKMKRYSAPLPLDKSLTMAGQYMTKSLYQRISSKPSVC